MPILKGFMVPHPPLAVSEVGRGDEKQIKATLDAFHRVGKEIAALKPDTIILTSPHSVMYSDFFHISPGRAAEGDFSGFGAGKVSFHVSYDEAFTGMLQKRADRIHFPAGTFGERKPALDHGTMVPLYFIDQYYTDYKLVRIGLSGLPLETHYQFGRLIRSVNEALGRRSVFIASGDLSHCQKEDGPYGYKPEGPRYDERLMEVMSRAAFQELLDFDEHFLQKSEECGHRSFVIMGGVFDHIGVTAEILSHEATFGVGYGIGIFTPKAADHGSAEVRAAGKSSDPLVALAKETVDAYVKTGKKPGDSPVQSPLFKDRAGAFVSIHEFGMLRGCIGTISAVYPNLKEEIRENAVSASTADPRFSPITEDELDDLDINVDVLSPAEPIDSMEKLDVKRYGVIVENGYRRGLLLPDLEGVDTVSEQVSIARRKAGIGPDEKVRLYRFEVVRHV
ncbi:MAG: AmmeMemoRadiSam system protein A [Lachnospiraceae bacterium]|nr:AmmeMemoRadiSam system protein A [Lachnospiraceae bacterium]